MKAKVSIKDVARTAGVSVSTVSFVMNGKGTERRISKKITEKILRIASDLNYRPNSFAQSLRTGKSRIIGFLVDDISAPFFSGVARILEKKALDHGYSILISCFGKKGEKAEAVLRALKARSVEGYVVAPLPGMGDWLGNLFALDKPVVLFDRFFPKFNANYVVTDHLSAVYDATLHLFEQGYSNICFVTTESDQQELMERLDGYLRAACVGKARTIVLKLWSEGKSAADRQLVDFIAANTDIGAFIFASSMLMRTALDLAKESKLDFLKKKGVVAFEDFDVLSYVSPAITAISQSVEETGNHIMKILCEELFAGAMPTGNKPHIIKVKANLVIRESTARSLQEHG